MDLYTSLYEADRDGHAARLSEAAETVFSEKCSQNVRNTGPDGPDPWSRLGDLNPGPTHYECIHATEILYIPCWCGEAAHQIPLSKKLRVAHSAAMSVSPKRQRTNVIVDSVGLLVKLLTICSITPSPPTVTVIFTILSPVEYLDR